MQFLDITLPLHHQTITWPGDPQVSIQSQYLPNDVTTSHIHLSTHSGTHIEAPRHLFPHGQTINQIPLEKINGECQVIYIKSSSPEITLNSFKHQLVTPRSRILFKTRNSHLLESGKFTPNYISLSHEVAQFLADRDIWLVGLDYLSIEPYNNSRQPIHKILISKQIPILEGIYLEHVPAGKYQLYCLPLSLYETEAAPCRAVLQTTNN